MTTRRGTRSVLTGVTNHRTIIPPSELRTIIPPSELHTERPIGVGGSISDAESPPKQQPLRGSGSDPSVKNGSPQRRSSPFPADAPAPVADREMSPRGSPMTADARPSPGTSVLSGHSEYVMQVMRDFFQSREPRALLETFRDQDTDQSGSLEYGEFRNALRKLNISLTEKDMSALFKVADRDSSGSLEFSEFFNNFRKDGFLQAAAGRREPFFWGKTRPRELLRKEERLKLNTELNGKPPMTRTKEEVMMLIQSQVDQSQVKDTFQKLDQDRSGRLSVAEFVQAMKDCHVPEPADILQPTSPPTHIPSTALQPTPLLTDRSLHSA